ncbi:Wadjet anti-phage system protein JetD domain-containing protein [Desulfopila sp. IMCC35008]|uniref:Wadjet anti-phage system protein JetD domain-containing protein n=1 Tax=Desulfopila sp. IMCC35008 TaxID=2653858 RepID=UPI0013D330CC|nr:Wadjet anti-phage system protein JetD domain-containing protein [Desulfopila sp. IMCC35008]
MYYDKAIVTTLKKLILKTAITRAKGKQQCVFQSKSFYNLLKTKTSYSQTDLNLALEQLFQEEFLSGRFTKGPFQIHGKITVDVPKKDLPDHEQDWVNILGKGDLADNEKIALLSVGPKLKGFSRDQMYSIFCALIELRSDQAKYAGKAIYDVSAKYFLGSSKLLSTIQAEARAFGINLDSFASSYRYISVAGNKNPDAVIIVENPHSFETAVQADDKLQYSWISSYGFGIALEKDLKYGEMLVGNLTKENHEGVIRLTRKGNPEQLSTLLSHKNLFFWGDLDLGGLQIFLKLQKNLPHLRLSGLYKYLAEEFRTGNAHPYTKAVAKEGQRPFSVENQEIKELLEICLQGGVDQEVVWRDEIMSFAGVGYNSQD